MCWKCAFFFFCSCWFSHLNNFCFNRTDTESARVYAECVPPNGRLCDVSAPFKAHQSRSRRSTQRCARGERGAEYNDRSLPNYNTGFQPRLLPERRKVVRTNSTGFVGAAMIEVNLLQSLFGLHMDLARKLSPLHHLDISRYRFQ